MPAKPLTAIAVEKAQPDPTRRIEIGDGGCQGLRLAISPTGSKSWVFRFKRLGKAGKLTIGPVADFTLKEAREAADEARRQLSRGVDPAAAKQERFAAEIAERAALASEAKGKVSIVLEIFLTEHADTRKSAAQIRRLLLKELSPWRDKPMISITADDARELLEDIRARGAPVTANRVRANARKFFGWANGLSGRTKAGLGISKLAGNPFESTAASDVEKSRDRFLNDSEITAVWRACDSLPAPQAAFVRLLLLTGQRRGEVAGMEWAELAFGDGSPTWTLPPARTKNGREHTIPICSTAQTIIESVPKIATEDGVAKYVLSSTGRSGLAGFSQTKTAIDDALKAAGQTLRPWTFHDLRRSVATGLARLGISIPIIEQLLNHRSGAFSGLVGVYQHHDYGKQKRIAVSKWSAHLSKLTKSDKSKA